MPAPKKPQSKKGPSPKAKKASKVIAEVLTGPVPPYGIAIRQAIARGNAKEMKTLAASTRKWLSDVSAALAQLESSVKKAGA